MVFSCWNGGVGSELQLARDGNPVQKSHAGARKIQAKGVQNARITRYDAWMVGELFPEESLSGLYTNHLIHGRKTTGQKRLL